MTYYDSRDFDKRKKAHAKEVEMPDRLKKALGIHAPTEIEDMNKAIKCLYLELPESIANDVKTKWDAAYNLLSKEISEKDEEIADQSNAIGEGLNAMVDMMAKLTTAKQEIERLKGLISSAFVAGRSKTSFKEFENHHNL